MSCQISLSRPIRQFTGILAITILTGAPNASANTLDRQLTALQDFQVVAHRGASGHAPEHTLPAFQMAYDMGADYLELDIQMTADGELVVLHDETLNRTTDAEGPLQDYTLAELQELDAGSWFNTTNPSRAQSRFAGTQVPTLDQVIDRFGTQTRYYIETKSAERDPTLEAELMEALEGRGLIEAGAVTIQSFSQESLRKVQAINPNVPLVQLVWYYPENEDSEELTEWTGVTPGPEAITDADFQEVRDYAVAIGTNMTYQGEPVIDEAFVTQAQDNDLLVHVYTVNGIPMMEQLLGWGVDGMFTNFPDRLIRLTQ
ncbi:glycerophosphodiester phosphodiesterase [Spiribacter vilamensis]|uniref:Glycerophosphoryl diester phosphodiesterase n=1 Tax=Spiribacter vilamensis TaxID=531306 RepID=A0A4Q8CYY5_9GAMM|nr:glycerophosphodiester phosphodiesterase [Spiribacter vilamensis]RZU98211.1 glycerophosphoryl diester phosphodiesterase [Spiribacter vilamensis]TVO60888.1 glycerophosphodiester phosphodiesterase [Spiribacter vilamensis]